MKILLIILGIIIFIGVSLFVFYIIGLREIYKGHQRGIEKLLKISEKAE